MVLDFNVYWYSINWCINSLSYYPKINTNNTHGTGCTLSSAIASNLALGLSVEQAVFDAKEYITGAIRNSLDIGSGNGPTNHLYRLTT